MRARRIVVSFAVAGCLAGSLAGCVPLNDVASVLLLGAESPVVTGIGSGSSGDEQAQYDLVNAVIAAETYATGNNGVYPDGSNLSVLADYGWDPAEAMFIPTLHVSGDGVLYCTDIVSDSGATFKIDNREESTGILEGACD